MLQVLVRLLAAPISGDPELRDPSVLIPAAVSVAKALPCDSTPPMQDFQDENALNGMKVQLAPFGP